MLNQLGIVLLFLTLGSVGTLTVFVLGYICRAGWRAPTIRADIDTEAQS